MPVQGKAPARANRVLVMLLIVYIFNFLDRMILSILAVPIQADIGLSDSEMGLLGGIAFAVLYSTLAVPLSSLADRTSRSWVITLSLVAWSGFTALCGFAQNFWHIFLARLGVGVGEAGGVAPSYAIIGDYFPPHRRAMALAVYSLGIPIGSAIGLLTGGYIAQTVNWRVAFIVIGLAGVVIAPIFKLTVRDLPRRVAATERSAVRAPDRVAGQIEPRTAPGMGEVVRLLARKPSFWFLSFGAATGSALGYGIGFWMPSFVHRSFGLDLFDTALFLAAVMVLGGVTGILAGGFLGDRLGQGNRAWYAWVPGIAYVVGAPFLMAGVASDNLALAFVLFVIPQGLGYFWLGPVLTAVQHLVEPAARATASALFLLINNLIGLGGGIYALGALSDALTPVYGSEALRMSIIWALGLYGLAGLLMAFAGRNLHSDWVSEG
ncbi:MAG: MFS transporter [Sphingomonadaceae bacterium]|nr:MFS transporter [Sphingomonadaceae bacterium]